MKIIDKKVEGKIKPGDCVKSLISGKVYLVINDDVTNPKNIASNIRIYGLVRLNNGAVFVRNSSIPKLLGNAYVKINLVAKEEDAND